MIIFITGGARSGKSNHAQQLALKYTDSPLYVATARKLDADFDERIKKHQADRGPAWRLFEADKQVSALPLAGETAVIDCVTLWLTNFFFDNHEAVDIALEAFKHEIDQLTVKQATLIIVSNEIGMGVHAEGAMTRKFVDLHGWANQYVAQKADEVYFMVSGIAMKVK